LQGEDICKHLQLYMKREPWLYPRLQNKGRPIVLGFKVSKKKVCLMWKVS